MPPKKYNLLEKIILRIIKSKISGWFKMEKELSLKSNFIKPNKFSPAKTWPNPEKIMSAKEIPFSLKNYKTIGKYLRSCVSKGKDSIKSLGKNHQNPTNKIAEKQLQELENYALSIGIGKIGFAKISRELIFQERAISYDNAIVLIMEMDKVAISKAPSLETFKMVFQTYDSLGIATNKLADYLRENNFNAHASHPLGGQVLYPPLAKKAGLGWTGTHGLLITPQFGARQRISVIFTNIENLPFAEINEHEWIQDFCDKCKKCVRTCPANAILKIPIIHPSKRETHIERSKCLHYFVDNQGCSVCLKNCVFSNKDYYRIKEKIKK